MYDQNFRGGRGGNTFKTSSPYEQLFPSTTPPPPPPPPPQHPTSSIFYCPSTTPAPIKILIVHFGELFSSRPHNSPSVHAFVELFSSRSFNSPSVHPFRKLFSSRPFNSASDHWFGELFSG